MPDSISQIARQEIRHILGAVITLIAILCFSLPLIVWLCPDRELTRIIVWGFLIFLGVLIALFVIFYVVMAIKDPDRLHNESHIYEMKKLMLGLPGHNIAEADHQRTVNELENALLTGTNENQNHTDENNPPGTTT